MARKQSTIAFVATLLIALTPCSWASAQDDAEQKDAKPSAGQAELEAYLKMAQPGPEHKVLRMRVGAWKVESTVYGGPNAEAMRSQAKSNIRPVLGGRYFRETYTGEYLGKTFSGVGTFGHDNSTKRFVSTWMDSMSTGIFYSQGTADESGKVITYTGEYFDGMRGSVVKMKSVVTLTSRKTHTTEMFEVTGDNERKIMTLVYTRVKRDGNNNAKPSGKGKKKPGAKKDRAKKKTDAN